MRIYELTYLVSPNLSDEESKIIQEMITSSVQNEGGVLNETNYSVKRGALVNLATLNFQLNPDKLESLEKKIKKEKQILRYLILTKRAVKPEKRLRPKLSRTSLFRKKERSVGVKPKVELKEIEKKLEEILGE